MNTDSSEPLDLERFTIAFEVAMTKGLVTLAHLVETVNRVDTDGLTANGPQVLAAHSAYAAAAREMKRLAREMERITHSGHERHPAP